LIPPCTTGIHPPTVGEWRNGSATVFGTAGYRFESCLPSQFSCKCLNTLGLWSLAGDIPSAATQRCITWVHHTALRTRIFAFPSPLERESLGNDRSQPCHATRRDLRLAPPPSSVWFYPGGPGCLAPKMRRCMCICTPQCCQMSAGVLGTSFTPAHEILSQKGPERTTSIAVPATCSQDRQVQPSHHVSLESGACPGK
jgi:hypothetical protein